MIYFRDDFHGDIPMHCKRAEEIFPSTDVFRTIASTITEIKDGMMAFRYLPIDFVISDDDSNTINIEMTLGEMRFTTWIREYPDLNVVIHRDRIECAIKSGIKSFMFANKTTNK